MTEQTGFQISQGFQVLPPRASECYPIPCDEWVILKDKIKKLSGEPWAFRTVGSMFLGAAVSTLIPILLGTYAAPEKQYALVVATAVVVLTFVLSLFCFFFSHKERGIQRERASDVIAQMDIIERRYERTTARAAAVESSQLELAKDILGNR